jgi:hypothetical protein
MGGPTADGPAPSAPAPSNPAESEGRARYECGYVALAYLLGQRGAGLHPGPVGAGPSDAAERLRLSLGKADKADRARALAQQLGQLVRELDARALAARLA